MSNKKLSSVDWLIEQVNHKGWHNYMIDIPKEIIQQAKAMHKDETKDAYNQGYRDGEMTTDSSRSRVDISEFNDADIYYDYTFGDESNK